MRINGYDDELLWMIVSRSIDADIVHGLRSILQHEARYPLAEVVDLV